MKRIHEDPTAYKDYSGYVGLYPGEKPPESLPFVPPRNPCPKCGYTDRIIWYYDGARRLRIVECRCGYLKEEHIGPYMVMTPEQFKSDTPMRGGVPLVELTCPDCGKVFKKLANNKSERCQRCRNNKTYREWRKAHPERDQATQEKYQGKLRAKAARLREAAKEFV